MNLTEVVCAVVLGVFCALSAMQLSMIQSRTEQQLLQYRAERAQALQVLTHWQRLVYQGESLEFPLGLEGDELAQPQSPIKGQSKRGSVSFQFEPLPKTQQYQWRLSFQGWHQDENWQGLAMANPLPPSKNFFTQHACSLKPE